MTRTRAAKHSKPVEPEDESQEVPEEAAVPPGPQDKGSISKSEAARQAITAGLECHRALQNRPLVGPSKPATILTGFGHVG